MIKALKHFISVALSFLLIFTILCNVNLNSNAATIEYVKSGKYIYNWGVREEVATFLSPNAEKFYSDNNTSYAALANLSGSSNISAVSSSALYKELQKLMATNHTHNTSYGETRYLYQYTDCQNSGKTSKKISSFYSGVDIGPSWDYGNTWNREHTWPKSKTNYKSVDNSDVNEATDIISLRPTASSENISRSNKAYGTVTNGTYFNPNHYANGKYDVRGDCARIMLYVYVRWGNTSKMWGSYGVIESKDILLKWVEEDPVDTWELGRNDSVESITGTRNVFVDYPELVFHLFGAQVPDEYQTPSNNAQNGTVPAPTPTPDNSTQTDSQDNTQSTTKPKPTPAPDNDGQDNVLSKPTACTHVKAQTVAAEDPRCDIEGYTEGKYCPDCKKYISGRDIIEALGHTYTGDCDDSCDVCEEIREISSDVNHSFDSGICKICGTKDANKPTNNNEVVNDNFIEDNKDNDEEKSSNNYIWLIFAIGGLVISIGGVTLIIIFRKRIWSKNQNTQ